MKQATITRNNVIQELRNAFPELEGLYQERADFWKGERVPSAYDVFGSVFRPRLNDDLEKGELTEFAQRAGIFIERVCNSSDLEAINVVWIEVFEWLIFKPKELGLLWQVMGPATRKSITDAARRWSDAGRRQGKTTNLPISNLPEE